MPEDVDGPRSGPAAEVDRWARMVVLIPTLNRLDDLDRTLENLAIQTVCPQAVIVLDNSPERSARAICDRRELPFRTVHHAIGRNAGPAGALRAGLAVAADLFDAEWATCTDDDGDVEPELLERLRCLVRDSASLRPAAVGLTGGMFDRRKARPHRIPVAELGAGGLREVDYIPGLGMPTYHLPSLRAAEATFDPFLFFGFEELDLGLQLRARGHRLITDSGLDFALRARLGRLALGPTERIPNRRTSPWRHYFSHRNRLIVGFRWGERRGVARLAARSVLALGRELVGGRFTDAKAIAYGLHDGLRCRPARSRFFPTSAGR